MRMDFPGGNRNFSKRADDRHASGRPITAQLGKEHECMKIGVLALQGAFAEHRQALDRLGAESFEIRGPEDLVGVCDGLILPGGESTVMGKLLRDLDLFEPLRERIAAGMPVLGTCAGLILLAKRLEGEETVHFGCMDIVACRNAYGRQLGSFFVKAPFAGREIPMTFIRAPYISSSGAGVEVLSVVDGHIVAARQDKMLVCAFHPELSVDPTVHALFLSMV